jgi:hypothetical protein
MTRTEKRWYGARSLGRLGGITDPCHDLAEEFRLNALPVAPRGLLQDHLPPPTRTCITLADTWNESRLEHTGLRRNSSKLLQDPLPQT